MAKRRKKRSGISPEAEKKGLLVGRGLTCRGLSSLLLASATVALCAILFKLLRRLVEIRQDTMSTGKDFTHHRTRFCLNVIMKNEEKVLERMFDSLVDEISGWFICDTGSTDNSVEITKNYFRRHQIPGKVKSHQWKDFSSNRNLCMKEGFVEMSGLCDYWMIFDADQQLVNETPLHLWQVGLTAEACYLKERSNGIQFSNLRILKLGDWWAYKGRIHETVVPVPETVEREGRNATIVNFPEQIYSIHDTNNTRTTEEDIDLMLEELSESPNSTRAHFYLAKAYHALPNHTGDALFHFSRMIFIDGGRKLDTNEWYYSWYAVAQIVEELYERGQFDEEHVNTLREHGVVNGSISSWEDVIKIYEQASTIWNHRYEPYMNIANIYFARSGNPASCYRYASLGLREGYVGGADTNLFTSDSTLPILRYLECICGYHSGQYDGLLERCQQGLDKLPRIPGAPTDWEVEIMKHTAAILEDLQQHWIP